MNEEQIAQLVQLLIQAGAAQDENQAMQIVQMASQGDQQAQQIIKEIIQQVQGGTPAARYGAKLNYLRKLKGVCPEGQELVYFKAGGRICKACTGKKLQPGGYIPGPITKDNPSSKYQQKPKPKTTVNKPKEKSEYDRNGRYIGINPNLRGKTRKEIEAMQKKNRQQATQGLGEGVPTHAKGGMLANKGTAFGDGTRGANPRNVDRGGHRSHGNTNAASYMKKTTIPNKFTAFGDTGRKKPTNVGLVGHRATGQVARMQSKYTTSDNVNKHTAFGAHINRSHRGSAACPSTKGWKKIKGAPRGGSGQTMGWKKYANGGTFVNFFQDGGNVSKYKFADDQFGILDDTGNYYSKDVYSNKWFVVPPGKGRWEFRPMTWVEDDNVMNELDNMFNTRYKTRADKYDYGEKLTRGDDGKYYHSDGKPVGRYWYAPIDTPMSTPTHEKAHINSPIPKGNQKSWGAESSDYTDRYFGEYANGGSLTAKFFSNFTQRVMD